MLLPLVINKEGQIVLYLMHNINLYKILNRYILNISKQITIPMESIDSIGIVILLMSNFKTLFVKAIVDHFI